MTAQELFSHFPRYILKRKSSPFPRQLTMEDHLQQQITELFSHLMVVIAFNRIDQLVHFLNGMKSQAHMILLAVPWTTLRRSQGFHDSQQVFNR